MPFEWDPDKAARNFDKHGVSFEEAATVFNDPLAGSSHDPDHSDDEDRYVTFGSSIRDRLVVVSHAIRGDNIRIINARPVTQKEKRAYEEND